MNFSNRNSHISDDALELYALKRLDEDELPAFEEHLLICDRCQDRLSDTDQYIYALKAATAVLRHEQPVTQPGIIAQLVEWLRAVPQPALALSFAAVLALVFIVRLPHASMEQVDLTATRKGTSTHVRSGVIPELRLSAEGLTPSNSYTVEVVNASGSSVWHGSPVFKDEKMIVTPGSPFSAGHYWIRLYTDTSRANMLREYSLTVD